MNHHYTDGDNRSRMSYVCLLSFWHCLHSQLLMSSPKSIQRYYRSKFLSSLQWLQNGKWLVVAKEEELPDGHVRYVPRSARPMPSFVRIVVNGHIILVKIFAKASSKSFQISRVPISVRRVVWIGKGSLISRNLSIGWLKLLVPKPKALRACETQLCKRRYFSATNLYSPLQWSM